MYILYTYFIHTTTLYLRCPLLGNECSLEDLATANETIYILEAIIFKMESKMADVRKIGSHIDFDVSNKNA